MTSVADRIDREIRLDVPRARVWRALANADEFGKWFGAGLRGKTFEVGQRVEGPITYPGYECALFDVLIECMERERLLAFRWHPYAVEPNVDYSNEPTTLVVFELSEIEGGTRLRIVETGFDKLPEARRLEAFRMNSDGWDEQLKNIRKHVSRP